MRSRVWKGFAFVALCCLAACGDNDNTDNDNGGGTEPTTTPSAIATPGPSSTAPPQIPCPQLVTYQVLASQSDLDTGWTGVYGGIPAGDGGSLTFAVDCPGEFLGQCGTCDLTGPVQSTTVINNQRCDVDTSIECTSAADCPSGGCSFYFGSPLAVSGGSLPICNVNRVAGRSPERSFPSSARGIRTFRSS